MYIWYLYNFTVIIWYFVSVASAFYWLKQNTIANGWLTMSPQHCDKMNVLLKHLFKKMKPKRVYAEQQCPTKNKSKDCLEQPNDILYIYIFWWSCNAKNKTCSDAMYIDIVIMFYVLIKSIFNLWYFKIASAVIVQYSWHSAQCV